MAAKRVVIVGGGPAGLASARAYRAYGGRGIVTVVCEEPLLPYRRPPLTKEFLRGELDAAELPIERQGWYRAHRVELQLGVPAKELDIRRGIVVLGDGSELQADAVVLATGSEPFRPEIPGASHPGVLTMRSLPDSRALAARAVYGRRVLVIGSGFIGCEIAASLALGGVHVTLITQERLPQLERLGEEVAARIGGWLTEQDVELIGDATVTGIHDGRVVELADGRRIGASCVVLATGVRPRTELAAAVGLELHEGAIVVDEAMQSVGDVGGVFAVGDAAFAHNTRARRSLHVEHWGDALHHGEIAGRTLAGGEGKWDGVPGFWSEIGEQTLKYAAWGDGYDECRLREFPGGAFTAWYSREGATVGVLTHDRDEDYERGRELVGSVEPSP